MLNKLLIILPVELIAFAVYALALWFEESKTKRKKNK